MTYSHLDLDLANGATLKAYARAAGLKAPSKLKPAELRDLLRDQLPARAAEPVPLFVELCAGTAALSLRLARERLRPPASRPGSKGSYADVILDHLGLHPGQGARHYLWCEPEAGCRVMLEAYRNHALAVEAAKIVRQWQDWPEGYRALWDSLRAKGPFVCPADSTEVARYEVLRAWMMHGELLKNTGYRGPDVPIQFNRRLPNVLADRLDALPELEATTLQTAVDPSEVARYEVLRAWMMHGELLKNTGYSGPDRVTRPNIGFPTALADRLDALPELEASSLAAAVEPAFTVPPGTVVYIDPPYVGTSGYSVDLPRVEVIRLARAWAAAGATVAISEQEAIPELVADGWSAVEITGKAAGAGGGRCLSKQKREFLTIFRRGA